MSNSYFAELTGNFIVFNDQPLSMEPITDSDIEPIEIPKGSPCASAAWSADCAWYFIVTDSAILLLNVHSNKGVRCNKKSALFIDAFLKRKK